MDGGTATTKSSALRVLVVLFISVLATATMAQQVQRQTRLILPKAVPGVEPVLVPQTGSFEEFVASFSPDGRYLVSGGLSSNVLVRDTKTLRVKAVLGGHRAFPKALAFSADCTRLATVSHCEALVWQIGLGPAGAKRAAPAAIGQRIARLLTYPPEADMYGGELSLDRVEAKYGLVGACFSPDGEFLVTCGWELILWDLSNGRICARAAPGDITESVGFTADGTKVVANRVEEPTAIVWDPATNEVSSVPLPSAMASKAVSRSRFSVYGSALKDPRLPADMKAMDGRELLWVKHENRRDRLTALFDGRGRSVAWRTGDLSCRVGALSDLVAASGPGAATVAYRDLPGIPLWFVGDGRRLLTYDSNPAYNAAVARLTPFEREFVDEPRRDPSALQGIPIVVRQNVIDVLTTPAHLLRLWDVATGGCVGEALMAVDLKDLLSVSPDGTMAAVAAHADLLGLLQVLDARTGRARTVLQQPADRAAKLEFSPDGRFLICHLLESGQGFRVQGLFAWDLKGGSAPRALFSSSVMGTWRRKLPDGVTWFPSSSFQLIPDGPRERPKSCASPDGRLEAFRSLDSRITLREVASGREVSWQGHQGTSPCGGLAFSPDGKILASASEVDGTKLWRLPPLSGGAGGDLPAPTELAALVTRNMGQDWLIATPRGYYDCSPGVDAHLIWLLGDELYPVEQFAERFRRPDMVRRVLRGEDISNAASLDAAQVPPLLAFTAPDYGATVADAAVSISLEAVGQSPISRIELWVGGRPVTDEVASALEWEKPTETSRAVTVTVQLPASLATLRLQAVACDTEGLRSDTAELLLLRPGAQAAMGARLHVLALGVSKYKNQAWNTIQYADDDATAFAQGFLAANPGLRPEQVSGGVMTDEQVTASALRFALRGLKDNVNEGDVVVVFVAGHGMATDDGSYYYLCHDSEEADLPNTALSWKEFVSLLRGVRATRIMLFVDTCHSGSVTGYDQIGRSLDLLNRQAGAMVFAASGGDEPSVEQQDWGHGAFTKALLAGLAGAADTAPQDGKVTLQELKVYTVAQVAELTSGAQHPCLPRLQDFEPEAVMARPANAGGAQNRLR